MGEGAGRKRAAGADKWRARPGAGKRTPAAGSTAARRSRRGGMGPWRAAGSWGTRGRRRGEGTAGADSFLRGEGDSKNRKKVSREGIEPSPRPCESRILTTRTSRRSVWAARMAYLMKRVGEEMALCGVIDEGGIADRLRGVWDRITAASYDLTHWHCGRVSAGIPEM